MKIVLNHLKDIASAVMYAAEARDIEQVLARIAQISMQLVNARYAAIGVPDDQGGMKHFEVAGMTGDQIRQIAHPPVGKGLLGAIMRQREIIRLPRMQDDDRAIGFPPGHPAMTSLLGVPIQIGQSLFGLIYLTDRQDGHPFDNEDQWLIEAMAGYAALAIMTAQVSEQKSRVALLEERERIGMELHDGVIQSLYAMGMHLDMIRTSQQIDGTNLLPVIDALNTVIEDIRQYIMNLKAKQSEQKSIYRCIDDLLTRLPIPESIEVTIDAPHEQPPFTPVVFESICLIVNEAVSNAARHASASHIKIRAYQVDSEFKISVIDDGQGFDLNTAAEQGGLGLHNIRQRTQLYGGHLHVKTAPGQGTHLTISIPLTV